MALHVFSRDFLFSFVGKNHQGQLVHSIHMCLFELNFLNQMRSLGSIWITLLYLIENRKDVWKIILLKHYLMKYFCYFKKSFIPVCTDTQSKTCVVKCAVKTESALFLLWKTFITLVFVTPLPQLLFIQSQLFRVEKPSKILRAESLLI